MRRPLTYVHEAHRFNYRVAAIIVRDRHVLTCREDDDPYVLLPGGRVELGETSDVALAREIEEELGCIGEVGRLVYSAENFFDRDSERFHEIGIYYEASLPDVFPFVTGQSCHIGHDEGHQLQFEWVACVPEALITAGLQPIWLRTRLADLPQTHEHVSFSEL